MGGLYTPLRPQVASEARRERVGIVCAAHVSMPLVVVRASEYSSCCVLTVVVRAASHVRGATTTGGVMCLTAKRHLKAVDTACGASDEQRVTIPCVEPLPASLACCLHLTESRTHPKKGGNSRVSHPAELSCSVSPPPVSKFEKVTLT